MYIDVSEHSPIEVYAHLVGIVTPRPIGWVSTVDPEGRVNLAPYSFFNVFSASPAVVVFSPTVRRDGTMKDTLRNVESTGEFVLNAAVESLVDEVNLSAKEIPHGESEADLAGLELVPSKIVTPPRVAASPSHLECRVLQIIRLGEGPMAGNLVLGQILGLHLDDSILGEDGKIDPHKMKTIGRLGGDWYCRTTDLFERKRPS